MVLWILAVLGSAASALAAGARVLLVGPATNDTTLVRMREELEVLGLDVSVIVPAPPADDLPLLAAERGAAAIARIEPGAKEVVLWVEPGAGAASPSELRVPGSGDPALLALRAVELLRGRLLPLPPGAVPPGAEPPAAAAPPPEAKPSPPPVAPAPDRAPRPARAPSPAVGLFAGPALLMSPGGTPVMPLIRAGVHWYALRPVGLEALAFIPTTAGSVSADEGTVALRVLSAAAGLRALLRDGEELAAFGGAGMGATLLLFEGEAAAPWRGSEGSRWVATPYATAGLNYRIHASWAVRGDLVVAIALPEPVVRIAGREIAAFGQPAVHLSLGVEAGP